MRAGIPWITGGLVLAMVMGVASPAVAGKPFRELDFDAARKLAEKEGKMVMLDFYTTWCGPCKLMDRKTFSEASVQAWMDRETIAIKIDADRNKALKRRFKVRGYPTILFTKPDGTEIARLMGFRGHKAFLKDVSKLSKNFAQAPGSGGGDGHGDHDGHHHGPSKSVDEMTPSERQEYARILEQKGQFKEALASYVWCFDEGLAREPGYASARLSLLLNDMLRFGQKYPPALVALRERRDAARKLLLAEPGEEKKSAEATNGKKKTAGPVVDSSARWIKAVEFAAINRYLGDQMQTLEVYDALTDQGEVGDASRKALFPEVLDMLLAKRRYGDIVSGVGDPLSNVEAKIQMYENLVRAVRKMGREALKHTNHTTSEEIVEEAAKYYEALLGVDREAEAAELAKRLLAFRDDLTTRVTLAARARRAGAEDAAKSVMRTN